MTEGSMRWQYVVPQSLRASLTRWWDQGPALVVENSATPEWITCPHCGGDNLHVRLQHMVIWPDFDEYDSPAGTRGEFILLPLECEECPQRSALTIGNHKGALKVGLLKHKSGISHWP